LHQNNAYFAGAYARRDQPYPRPNDPSNPTSEDHLNERRISYPVASVPHGMQPTMQPTMSPGLNSSQGKDQGDGTGNNSNSTPNMGYSVPMNNPIPNPINSGNTSSSGNRGNFESDPYAEEIPRNDQMHYMYTDKLRVNKRTRTSQPMPPAGAQPLPVNDVYSRQPKVVSRRVRSPGGYPIQPGSSVSQSPQGTGGQTQSTPPNHTTPPGQTHSPTESLPMSSASMHGKQHYNSGSVYYPGKGSAPYNPGYAVNTNSGGQPIPANYGMPYPGQPQSVNYNTDPQQAGNPNNYVTNGNFGFVTSMKGNHGGYVVQKSYAHPSGRFGMSGMIPKNKTQYNKSAISMNHDGEGSENMNMGNNESNLPSMSVESNMLTNDYHSDPLYTGEQSLNSEGSMDIF